MYEDIAHCSVKVRDIDQLYNISSSIAAPFVLNHGHCLILLFALHIQDALDDASPGDTIVIEEGHYYQGL